MKINETYKMMNGPALVSAYNEMAAKLNKPSVKRFSTRAVGIKRVEELAIELGEIATVEEAKEKPSAKKASTPKKPVKVSKAAVNSVKSAVLKEAKNEGRKATIKEICKNIFDANIDENYTRVQFIADCMHAGASGSTAAGLWLPFGGSRKFSRK